MLMNVFSREVEKGADSEVNVLPKMAATASEQTFPEGGVQAWLTVLGGSVLIFAVGIHVNYSDFRMCSWFAVFATFGYANAFGIYQDLYTRQGAASASRISWVGSTQIFFLIASGLPAGKLFDMGYCRETALFGSLLYVFS